MAAVFHLAVSEGDVTKVRFLMKYSPGLRVDSVNKFGLTALQQSALDGNVDIVNFLLEKGADLNCVDTDGRTALHLAAQEGHLGVVSLLVTSACANVNAKTKQGYKAIELAQSDQVRALLSQAMLTESFKRKCSFDEDDFESHAYVQEYRNTPGCRNSFSSASTDSGVCDESYMSQDGFGHRSSQHRSSLRGYPSSRHSVISEDSGISDTTTYDSRNRCRSSSIDNNQFRSGSIENNRARRVDDLQTTSILRSNSFTTNRDDSDSCSSVETVRSEMQRYRRAEPKAYVRDASRRKTVTFGVTEKERETGRAETWVKYCGSSYNTQEETTKTRRITKPLPPVPCRVPPRAESSPIPPGRNTKPPVPPREKSPVVSPRGESPPVPPRVKSPPVPSPRSTSPRSGSPSPTPSPRIAPRASPEPSPRFPPRSSPEPSTRIPPRKSPMTSPRSPPNASPRMPSQPYPLVTPRSAITPRSASMKVRGESDHSGGYDRVVPRRPRTEMASERRDVHNRRSFHAGFSSRGVN